MILKKQLIYKFLLIGILVLSLFLNLYKLGTNGSFNPYYAVAVKSMNMNFHNFIYNSYDPFGYMTIDKPPIAFWVQTLFVKIFGFHTWSVMLPQALLGVAVVYLMYHLMKKYFSIEIGLISALVLTLTPILLAGTRSNFLDVHVVFYSLLSLNFLTISIEKKSLSHLIISFVLVGLCFNLKFVNGFLILPALGLVYLFLNPLNIKQKVFNLVIASLVLFVVAFSWVFMVDITAKDKRPYVSSTQHNLALELSLGHLPIAQAMLGLSPEAKEPPIVADSGISEQDDAEKAGPAKSIDEQLPELFLFDIGKPGILRLFNYQMADQIAWFMIFALVGIIIYLFRKDRRNLLTQPQVVLLFSFLIWLIPQMFIYSSLPFMHRYYLLSMVPALAGLTGFSLFLLIKLYKEGKVFYLPLAIIVTAIIQIVIVERYTTWNIVLIPIIAIISIIIPLLPVLFQKYRAKLNQLAIRIGFGGLLLAPLLWCLITPNYKLHDFIPYAGVNMIVEDITNHTPRQKIFLDGLRWFQGANLPTGLRQYLLDHYQGEKYLAAFPGSKNTSPFMLESGIPILAFGGFLGATPAITIEKLQGFLERGELKYIALMNAWPLQPHITSWILEHCTLVDRADWNYIPSSIPKAIDFQLYRYDG